ncbi:unnamed protein product, partial [Meganyctiphanes norvegica]
DTDTYDLETDGETGPFNIDFQFKADLTELGVGTHQVLANLSNEVSTAQWNVTVIMLEAIVGIDWDAGFELVEDAPLIPPGGKDENILPANLTVKFMPSVEKGAVSVSYWGLYSEDVLIANTTTADEDLKFTFTEEGLFNITIKAYSEAEGWVEEKNFTYEVLNKVQGMEVTDFNIITPTNKTKHFSASFETLHPLTCLFVNWNDDTLECYGEEALCENKFPKADYIENSSPLTN